MTDANDTTRVVARGSKWVRERANWLRAMEAEMEPSETRRLYQDELIARGWAALWHDVLATVLRDAEAFNGEFPGAAGRLSITRELELLPLLS